MQHNGCRLTIGISHEGQLRVDDLEEVIRVTFRKDLDFRLTGRLRKEAIPFAGNRQHEIRRQWLFYRFELKPEPKRHTKWRRIFSTSPAGR